MKKVLILFMVLVFTGCASTVEKKKKKKPNVTLEVQDSYQSGITGKVRSEK